MTTEPASTEPATTEPATTEPPVTTEPATHRHRPRRNRPRRSRRRRRNRPPRKRRPHRPRRRRPRRRQPPRWRLRPPTSTSATEPTTTSVAPTTTAGIEPPAVVATLPPNAPPPAVNTAGPATTCTGDPGELDAQGVPANLPTRVQLGGVAYLFAGAEAADAVGTLTTIGCVGPFELARTDQADQAEVIYLRSTQSGPASQQVYRFEAAPTYQIELQVTGQPQVIAAADQTVSPASGLAPVDLLQPVGRPLRRGSAGRDSRSHLRSRRLAHGRRRRHR